MLILHVLKVGGLYATLVFLVPYNGTYLYLMDLATIRACRYTHTPGTGITLGL
jgi:hypothetical protein